MFHLILVNSILCLVFWVIYHCIPYINQKAWLNKLTCLRVRLEQTELHPLACVYCKTPAVQVAFCWLLHNWQNGCRVNTLGLDWSPGFDRYGVNLQFMLLHLKWEQMHSSICFLGFFFKSDNFMKEVMNELHLLLFKDSIWTTQMASSLLTVPNSNNLTLPTMVKALEYSIASSLYSGKPLQDQNDTSCPLLLHVENIFSEISLLHLKCWNPSGQSSLVFFFFWESNICLLHATIL